MIPTDVKSAHSSSSSRVPIWYKSASHYFVLLSSFTFCALLTPLLDPQTRYGKPTYFQFLLIMNREVSIYIIARPGENLYQMCDLVYSKVIRNYNPPLFERLLGNMNLECQTLSYIVERSEFRLANHYFFDALTSAHLTILTTYLDNCAKIQ